MAPIWYVGLMRLGRAILTFALALMWLGMPVHCQLEAVSTASLFACADDVDCSTPTDRGCEDDFCNSLESGDYFPQKNASVAKALLTPILFELFSVPPLSLPPEGSVQSSADTVPLLSTSWHFVQRVAAPPRAPSFLS